MLFRSLWNSFVLVAAVPALLGLMKHAVPDLVQAFHRARPAIDTESEAETFSALYMRIPSVDFSGQVLASRPANLAVLRVSGVAWSDLGDPGRVMATLSKTGIEPEWAREQHGALEKDPRQARFTEAMCRTDR